MADIALADSWAPVKRGLFYGSAQCCHARLCTLAAFDQAGIEARKLADHLGPGWQPEVWENLGWHYAVGLTSGDHKITVHPQTTGSHTAGGWSVSGYSAHLDHQWWQDDATPEGAVIKVIAAIRAQMDTLGNVLAKATKMGSTLIAEAESFNAPTTEEEPTD